jgi:hypothetical protein
MIDSGSNTQFDPVKPPRTPPASTAAQRAPRVDFAEAAQLRRDSTVRPFLTVGPRDVNWNVAVRDCILELIAEELPKPEEEQEEHVGT